MANTKTATQLWIGIIIRSACLCLFLMLSIGSHQLAAQGTPGPETFAWPHTAASKVFQEYMEAQKKGDKESIRTFVKSNYTNRSQAEIDARTEVWLDYFYRFGTLEAKELSINKELDLEVWLQGKVSKTWIAIEFILHEDSGKIRAVGNIQGTQPEGHRTPSASQKSMIKTFENYLDENEAAELFQGVVLIKQGDKTLLNKAYGYKDKEASEKNSRDTRMRLASVTKIFTAVAVLQMVQNKQLSLNAPISTYLDDYPKHISDQIAIHDLLIHSSGYELDGIDGFRKALQKTNGMEEVLKVQLAYLDKWEYYKDFKNPSKYNYSNDDFDLLAIIVERVSGMDFRDYIKTNIFEPSGMTETSFSKEGVATPYRYDLKADQLISHESYYPYQIGNVSGAAGLISTAEDLANFFETLFKTDILLDFSHKSALFAPHISRGGGDYYGYGIHISYDGALHVGHSGSGVGNRAELRYFPESDYLFIALSNNRSGAPNVYRYFTNIITTNNTTK